MATDDEAIANECIDDLIMNVIKSIRNVKKRPDGSSIRDYVSKLSKPIPILLKKLYRIDYSI